MNAIHFYRVGRFCYEKKIPIIPGVVKFLIFFLFNSVIPVQAEISKNSRFMYGGIGVVLHKKSKIGRNVAIGQGVTLGRKLKDGAPIIGDDVYIAAGSRILGDIRVGDNVIIGANSVVISDIPSNTIVAGSPAKIVKKIDSGIYEILGDII